MKLLSFDEIFTIVFMNFCGAIAPWIFTRHFGWQRFTFLTPSTSTLPLEDALPFHKYKQVEMDETLSPLR